MTDVTAILFLNQTRCAEHPDFIDGEGVWGGEEYWVNEVSPPNPCGIIIILRKTPESSPAERGLKNI
jgi:hypothetical protein